jgi:hypothetical protein
MALSQEYDSTIAYNYDILFRQFEIDVSRMETEATLESTFYEMEEELFCEAETLSVDIKSRSEKKENKSRFSKTLSKIAEAISKFINDVIQMVSDMFSGSKKHLDLETYLNSAQGSIEMEKDLERVHKQVREEIRSGRKLIKAIARGTGIDESEINNYVDKAVDGIQDHGKTIIKTASTYKKYQQASGNLKEMKDEMVDALTDCKDAAGDPEKQVNVMRVYKAMKKWVTEATNVYSMFSRKIYAEAMKQQQEEEKKKKNKGGR